MFQQVSFCLFESSVDLNRIKMQREEKLLESALDAISQRINDLKSSIHSLISKLQEDPNVNWPSVLDSFALISGQVFFDFSF